MANRRALMLSVAGILLLAGVALAWGFLQTDDYNLGVLGGMAFLAGVAMTVLALWAKSAGRVAKP